MNQVLEWQEKHATSVGQHDIETTALRQEVAALKSELVLIEKGTVGLQRTIEFYKTAAAEATVWKDRCAELTSQIEALSAQHRFTLESHESDTMSSNSVQSALEEKKKEVEKLKAKVKRYAEKIAGMEVEVAEAAIIKAEANLKANEQATINMETTQNTINENGES